MHCVTQRIYCSKSWNFRNSTNLGRRDIWPCHAKMLKRQLIFKRNQTQEQLSKSKAADGGKGGRDRDWDIFSLWSTHGKTVHGNEHSDSVWFSDDSWVTAGDLHVKVAKKALRSISDHIIEVATFTFWGHQLHILRSQTCLLQCVILCILTWLTYWSKISYSKFLINEAAFLIKVLTYWAAIHFEDLFGLTENYQKEKNFIGCILDLFVNQRVLQINKRK